MSADPDLSSRERDILLRLTRGRTTRQIAKELFLSEGTVKTHLTSIYRKLGVTNRTEAAVAGSARLAVAPSGGPGDVTDPTTETKIWKPQEAETLDGTIQYVGTSKFAVETEDGSVWLLEADAENQLEALEPAEGQAVRVSFAHQSWPRSSNYAVSLR